MCLTHHRERTRIVGSMYRIGLTGNIATGKSTVLEMLVKLGAETIDADTLAHRAIAPQGPAHAAVVDSFGQEIVRDDGTIDRGKLGAIVFDDPEALRRLERLVHPAVGELIEQRVADSEAPVVVIEAIKLVETGRHQKGDALWIVTAPREQQVRRLMEERGLDREEAEMRIDAQPPVEPKLPLADVVIENDGTLADLWEQVRAAWERIPEEKRTPK